ncbi:fibronectin type III domain-containing protein [Winogradskyella sp.]|uniref:fibronectin type III domain-containing protein n=1 Tax=Winogradskyella sp. TaxID=1883156 RepID=UPI0026375F2E|nr:fibronectin type III domain-containing protein [Winogradskyella sp.]
MKKITLLLLLFMMLFYSNAQVTIGAGNLQTENGPFEAYFGFSYVQTIYLASEINASGDISDIQWYYSGTSALPNSQDLTIYMAELPRTEFADTNDWEPISSFTQVYTGGITVTAGVEGWVTITLDAPFTYTGTGNLVIAVEENSPGFDQFSDDFYNTQVTTNRSISFFSDSVNPDPLAPPTANNIDVTIANIILGGITQSCPTPTGLDAMGVTSDEAQLSWTENGTATTWNIEIVPEGSMQTETPTNTGVSNPFMASGLTPATNYTYYVQSDCGGEVSAWAGPFAFSTECVTFTAPYTEDFENSGSIPLCWAMDGGEDWFFDVAADVGGEHVGDDGVVTGTTASNGYFAWADSSGNDGPRTLTSPLIDISSLAVPTLSFYLISDNEGNANSNLDVEVWDGAAWNNLGTFNTNTNGWELRILDLSGLTITGDAQVRFIFSETVTGDFYDDIAIDDVTLDEAPACFNPTFLTATNITATEATLSWTQDGTVTQWNVEIVTAGTAPTGTATDTGVPNPFMASGLTPATDYEYYVQADCNGNLSGWVGPFAFSTECVTFTAPYTEDFENAGTIPLCWSMDGGEDWFFDVAADVGGEHVGDDGVVTGSTASNGYFAWADSSGDEGPRTLTSPLIDVTGLTVPALSFYLISDNEGNANSDLNVEVWDGAAWNNLGTFNTNTNGWELQILGLSGLTITGDIQVRFIFSETVPSDFYDDTAIDDVTIDEAPACIAPSGLTASNINGTSADISWNANNSETSWEYVLAPAGTGEPSGSGTTVAATSVPLSGLDFSTSYEVWVRADCGANGFSDWAGPLLFETPIQTDFTLDCTSGGPLTQDYCYDNDGEDTPLIFTFTSNDGTPLNLIFNSGFIENNWDELVVLDSDGTPFPGWEPGPPGFGNGNFGNAGDISGLVFQSSGDTISWYINSDGSVSCVTGSTGNPLIENGINYTVSCATCINPEATYTVVDDCENGDQFLIDVDITSLGDATSLTISNNIDATTVPVTATGTYQIGPFPFMVDVVTTISNDQDTNCVINSPAIQLLACPPENDNPCDATVAVVNSDILCEVSTPGSIIEATPSGVPDPSCGSSADDDVWFQFVAESEFHLISLANVVGSSATDMDISIYGGTCDNLTELACVADFNDWSITTPSVTIGETYFIRVNSGGTDSEDTTFDLCITPYIAPVNISCDLAENFCSGSDALDVQYSYNTINFLPGLGTIDCLGTTPNPTFSLIELGSSGDILLEIVQNSAFDANDNPIGDELDVDFLLWGPLDPNGDVCVNGDASTINAPFVDCSFSPDAVENVVLTGAQEGELYLLLITNWIPSTSVSPNPGVIQIRQTNLGDPGAGSLIADLEAELISNEVVIDSTNDPMEVDEVSVCGFDSVTIETDSPFADTFIWFEDGFEISGETSSTLTVPTGGFGLGATNYQVQAFDNQCGAEAFSQIVIINFYDDAGTVDPQNITICDGPSSDGVEDFDLDQLTTDLGFGPDFTVSYYTSTADANMATGAVSSPYSSSGETLIIRVEDTDASNDGFLGCRQLSQVELVVLPAPLIGMPDNLETCSALTNAEFTLTDNDSATLNGLNTADYTVTYHNSEMDAENDTGALTSPYSGTNGEIIYVRLEENTTGCYNIASFSLIITTPTQTATSQDIEECDDNDDLLDDTADFDLSAHTSVVLGSQNPSNFNVTYHTSQSDADNNTDALPDIYSTASTTIYVRVEDATLPNCYVTNSFNLVVLDEVTATIETNVFYYDDDTNEFLLCPEADSGTLLTLVPQGFNVQDVSIQWLLDGFDITGATGLSYEAVSPGDYAAVITLNATGCSFTVSDLTVVELENCVIPQGISPGVSVGFNDTFDLRYFDVTRLEIFNRNGTLVYSRDNYTNEWVGQTNDGEELPVGTYFYTMVYEGGTKTRSAWVYINR